MNSNHKPGFFLRFCLVLIFLLSAGALIVSNSSKLYADDEKAPEEIAQTADDMNMSDEMAQNSDDEQMSEEMARKIEELEKITIENKGYKKDRKGPVEFEHVKHSREYQISCWECHHEYNKDEQDSKKIVEKEQAEEIAEDTQTVKKEEPKPKYLTEQNIWSPWGKTKKCAECHDPKEKKDDVIVLQAAYHLNCKTCHKDRKIFGNDILAYRKCTGCHK